MRLLVADDEELILEGITQAIPWSDYGIEICATALDGLTALKEAHEHTPELVITDIRMPGISGLDLVTALAEELPEVQIIIVSAHEDFEYAQRALREGVLDYLVKPIDTEVLLETVLRAKRTIEATHRERVRQGQLESLEEESRDPLLRHLVHLAFRGTQEDVHDTQACLIRTGTFQHRRWYRGVLYNTTSVRPVVSTLPRITSGTSGEEIEMLWQAEEDGALMVLLVSDLPVSRFGPESDRLLDRLEAELRDAGASFVSASRGAIVDALFDVGGSVFAAASSAPLTESDAPDVSEELRSAGPSGATNKPAENPLARRAAAFIDDHLYEDVSLAHAAQELSVNPAYLSRLFKQERGITFMEHLTSRKIEEAKRLLRDTTLYSYEIADRLGYRNSQYFSRLFKSRTGQTPQEYRRSSW